MKKMPVSQLKIGYRLSDDVLTKRGNVLLQGGLTLKERELELLTAFQIDAVHIAPLHGDDDKTEASAPTNVDVQEKTVETPSFHYHYEQLFKLLKKTFMNIESRLGFPILEIRNKFEALIERINDYNMLSFAPRNWKLEDRLFHNSIKVGLTSYCLAKWHSLPAKDLIPVGLAGLFHDIGTMKIDKKILNKPSKLTDMELSIIKEHPNEGYNILKNVVGINEGVKLATLQHHEKEDGSGYPLGIKGNQIHIYAKIVSIADIFHAMTSERHHRESYSPYIVLEQLYNESFGKLDPFLVQTFIKNATRFNIGTIVKLNDGQLGEIVFSHRDYPTRPLVKVKGEMINLATNHKYFIKEVIK